jgi:predicted alpha-1,2-mannosidase
MVSRLIVGIVCGLFSLDVWAQDDPTAYIDPRIGNVSQFLVPTYPTFSLPNQMLRMFPVKRDYIDDQIDAFPLQVVSHRSPGIFQMKVFTGDMTPAMWKKRMSIDHDLETMHPWLYSTYLIDDDVTVSFSPGKRCAIYKVQYPSSAKKQILIGGTDAMRSSAAGPSSFVLEETIEYKIKDLVPTTRTMQAYCYVELVGSDNEPVPGVAFEADSGRVSMSMTAGSPSTIFLRYGISYVSQHQARQNLLREAGDQRFEEYIAKGKAAWAKVMGQIAVEGGTDAQKRTFYTSLYRTYERMIDINEDGQYYSGYDGRVHQSDRPFYVDDWIWDSYRAHHPLRTILDPAAQSDMLNSYVLMYEQSGWLPTFPQVHGNHMCMNSYHSSAIFIDAYRKGIRGYDVEKAYEGIRKNLTMGTAIPWRQGIPKRPIDDFYLTHGYYPALQPGEKETEPLVDPFEKRQAVAVTLGISYDAWTLSQLAYELKKEDDARFFFGQSRNYRKLWHPELRLFMPKDDRGNWIMINPKSDGGPGYRDYYDENNGWTYAWDVQHDIDGLIDLLGGRTQAEERLDQLFREPLGMRKNQFYVNGSNSTGMVGQFSMGNEPSFHIPYLYNYFGAPWKTQKMTRFLLDVWFKDNIFGIPGDEDGGGMCAFAVFSSMGFYPVTPGIPVYAITSPVFEKITISLSNGKTFEIVASGASKRNKYIQKAFLNGAEIDSPFVTHEQIVSGGKLEMVLAERPNREWGKNAVLPRSK